MEAHQLAVFSFRSVVKKFRKILNFMFPDFKDISVFMCQPYISHVFIQHVHAENMGFCSFSLLKVTLKVKPLGLLSGA